MAASGWRSYDGFQQSHADERKKKMLMWGVKSRMCGSVRACAVVHTGLPEVKDAQQASRGSGMENHQGRLDPDSRPGAEEFRASSS